LAVLEDAAATVLEALSVVVVAAELEAVVEGLLVVVVVEARRLAALQLATFEASIANRPWSAGQLL
jgi:hypothetical protein